MDVTLFITGATGFVGGAIARRLLAEGAEVRALVRDRSRAGELEAAGAELVEGSVGDPNLIARAAAGCSRVVHAAAIPDHRASERALGWVNVAGTENVVRAAEHAGVKRLVHVSCVDVTLHNGVRTNWNEDQGLIGAPLDAHAISKLEAEELVIGAGHEGFETTALRPALVWGPGDHTTLPGLCEEGLGEGGIALCGKGDTLVATTYVDNFVDAVLLALERPEAGGAVYHVTDDDLTLAVDFYGALSAAAGLPPPRTGKSFRLEYARAWARCRMGKPGPWPTEVVRRNRSTSFSVEKARTDLGYEPRVRQAEGMERLAAWVEEQGGPRAVAALRRPPATDEAVASQVDAATR